MDDEWISHLEKFKTAYSIEKDVLLMIQNATLSSKLVFLTEAENNPRFI
jgi:hypothetical protein